MYQDGCIYFVIAEASHQTPGQVIGKLVREKIAASA
jgi:hypothetical protein